MENENPFTPPESPNPNEPGIPGMPTKEDCNMAMLAHLLGALIGFLGPLIIWLTKKDTSPFVDDQGKEALNFQLTMLIGYFATAVVGVLLSCITFGLSGFLPFIVWVLVLVFGIQGAMTANKGVYYRYPICIRMIT